MKKYQIIYADPPWRYDFSKSDSRQIENQYPTMSVKDIEDLVYELPIDTNAVLYLWATAPKMREALSVMEKWGFEYKSQAVWDKKIVGMGYWFRGQHEILLVGTKGHFSPPAASLRVSSVFSEQRGKHSKKPEVVRDLIKLWYPHYDAIELFARERIEGWDSWGNEIESDVTL